MRLPGRIAAAVEVLADMEARHRPASDALKDWGLSHRFAGAGDRAAIGNLVHDALRRRLSIAWRMGGDSPWHLAVGVAVLHWGLEPLALNDAFTTDRHAPPPLPEETIARLAAIDLADAPDFVRADVPEWLAPFFARQFGPDWVEEGAALAGRPPLDLRVNTLKTDRAKAAVQLAATGVAPTQYSPVGLRIPPPEAQGRHPHIQAEEAYLRGRVEIQDESSQLCALLVGARAGEQVVDVCAGAGGKTLAWAAQMANSGQIYAHDSDKSRLAPIFDRIRRAGARNIQVRPPAPAALDDLAGRADRVLVDAPCTGTGVWRRRPDAKWRVSETALVRRIAEQQAVLEEAARLVRPGGILAYATCSVLPAENADRIAAFVGSHPDFDVLDARDAWRSELPDVEPPEAAFAESFLLLSPRRTGTDGFFLALLRRAG